ncbi:MAG: hypothetical protein JWM52_714 [Candidatus Saccharibacteria bacterium]|nr:hypothetical protein [Candidatus Saccharibacteria bacterium]
MSAAGIFRGGEGLTELFPGVFHTTDPDNPDFHDGRFIHMTDAFEMAKQLGHIERVGSYAMKSIHESTVELGRQTTTGLSPSLGARLIDWEFGRYDYSEEAREKRRRLFYANQHVATAFYEHLILKTNNSATKQFDVIEALLKARGVDRPDERRAYHLHLRSQRNQK